MGEMWMILVAVNIFLGGSRACRMVPGWRSYVMEERLSMHDIVVIGTDIRHVVTGGSGNMQIVDAKFKVTCILKGDLQVINETITIKEIEPRTSCTRTVMEVGRKYIAGLRRDGSDYRWHEANSEAAAFPYTENNLGKALSVCGLQDPYPPFGVMLAMCPGATHSKYCQGGVGNNAAQKLIVVMCFIFSWFSAVDHL